MSGSASLVAATHRPMNAGEGGILLGLSVLWGSSFFFYKVLGGALPTFTIVLGRMGIAAVVLNLVLLARGEWFRRGAPWGQLLVLGVLNCVVPFGLFAWGETQISSGMAAMLNATTPLFAVLMAHVVTRAEKLTWLRAGGVGLGMCGVAVLVGPTAVAGARGHLLGDGACLAAAFTYAVAGQYARRLRGVPFLQVATGQLTAGALVLLPVAAVVDRFWALPMPGVGIWLSLAGIAVLCTALAYILFFRLMATAGPTNAMLVTFLLPISALLLGWLFLGEAVPARAFGGMALIGAGLALMDGRLFRLVSLFGEPRR